MKKLSAFICVLIAVLALNTGVGLAKETVVTLWCTGLANEFSSWITQEFPKLVKQVYPDITLEVTVVNGRQALEEKRLVATAAGVGPDIFHEAGSFGFQAAHNGSALALDHLIADWNEYRDLIPMPHWTYQGKTYGIPYTFNMTGLGYWEDILQNNGMTPPSNWDEILSMGRKLTLLDSNPARLERAGLGMFTSTAFMGVYPLQIFMEQLGSRLFTSDFRTPQLNTAEARMSLEMTKQMWSVAFPGGARPINDFFKHGTAMQFWMSNWHTPRLAGVFSTEELKSLRIMKVPGPTGAAHEAIAMADSWAWVISSASENVEASFQVIKRFLDHDVQLQFLTAFSPGGLLSPRRSFRYPSSWPFIQDAMRMTVAPITTAGPAHPLYNDVLATLNTVIPAAVKDERALESTLVEAQRLTTNLLQAKGF